MSSAYYLTIEDCPLIAWEKRFKQGYSSIRICENKARMQGVADRKDLPLSDVVDTEKSKLIKEARERFLDSYLLSVSGNEEKLNEDELNEHLLLMLDYEAWNDLYIDWHNNTKKDEEFERYIRNLEHYDMLMIKYIQSEKGRHGIMVRDNSMLNEVRYMRAIIEKYEKNLGKGIDVNKMVLKLGRAEGRTLDKRKMTVKDYFDLIELNS